MANVQIPRTVGVVRPVDPILHILLYDTESLAADNRNGGWPFCMHHP